MPQAGRPDFTPPDLSAGAPDLSGTAAPSRGAQPSPGSVPQQGWSKFDKPVGSAKVALWGRIWPVLLVLALILVVGGAGYGIFFHGKSPVGRQPLLGTCTVLSGTRDNVSMAGADCGARYFTWLIAMSVKTSDQCPEEYAWVSTDEHDGPRRQFGALCLMPNFHQGDCYEELAESDLNGYSRVECTDAAADFRVAAVHDKKLASLCQPDTEAWPFPEPARTFCLGEP